MNSNKQEIPKDLRLHGEQINLSSRYTEETKKALASSKCRPKSALYTSNLNIPEYGRRPFSAGTEPQSSSLHTFSKRAQTDRPSIQNVRKNEFFNEMTNLPGTIPSSILFEKMMRDPIESCSKFSMIHREYDSANKYNSGFDNMSENSSVETCVSFGTKIKERAQNGYRVEGNSIKLKKCKPQKSSFFNDAVEDDLTIEQDEDKKKNEKLSIYVPHSKDDNTSSGVSSSSDVQCYSGNQLNAAYKTHNGKQASDAVSLTHKLHRSKRSPHISINWFPQNYSDKTESVLDKLVPMNNSSSFDDNESRSNNDALAGRVSFGTRAFQSYPSLDGSDLYSSHQAYNTQLSLVEEESSQESDMSPKHLSLPFNSVIKHEELEEDILTRQQINPMCNGNAKNTSHSQTVSNNARRISKIDKVGDDVSTVNSSVDYTMNNTYLSMYNENEIERKFKVLEDKYKNEKLEKNSINSGTNKNLTQSYSWTSLENIVSKEYEPSTLQNGQTKAFDETKTIDSAIYESLNCANKNLARNTNSFMNGFIDEEKSITNMDNKTHSLQYHKPAISDHSFDLKNFEENQSNLVNSSKITKSNNNCNVSLSGENSDMSVVNNQKSSLQNTPTFESFGSPRITGNYYDKCSDKTKNKMSFMATDNNANGLSISESKQPDSLNYPQYLEKTDTKIYTSQVIEDYKREIASINNHHDLTLKDLRNKCPESSKTQNYKIQGNDNITSMQTEKDSKILHDPTQGISNKTIADKTWEKPNTSTILSYKSNDYLQFMDDQNKYNSLDDEMKISDDSSLEKLTKKFFNMTSEKNDTKVNKQKSKKKTKKRNSGSVQKNEAGNSSTEAGSNEVTKGRHSSKRMLKSAPITKKTNTNCIKFKSQKITLSKSTTNVNRTVYMDSDKDVISWMATRANTPFDETSSCENPETITPDIMNPCNGENKDLHILSSEKNIEPVIKVKSSFMAENGNNNRAESLKMPINRTGSGQNNYAPLNKSKEVSFDIVKSKPKYEVDESFLNDWTCNDSDGQELNDIVENNSMVSDIYSVLKDIENHGMSTGTGDGNDSKLLEKGDNLSAEYKDIVSYLERVENTASEEMSSLSHTQPPFALKVEELMELSKAELAHRAVAGALAAGKAGATVAKLQVALVNAAKRAGQRIKDAKIASRQKAAAAGQIATKAVARHQKFIEQLISEKAALNEKIQQLVGVAAGAEARRTRATRMSADKLQMELKNQRQRLNSVHQREKQAWLKQHTQKIKEMTLKGLESELKETEEVHSQRIISMQQDNDAHLTAEREHHAKEIRILKDTAARQLEDELDKERLLAAERLERKRVEWESAMSNATCRAAAESREALRRAESAAVDARNEAQEWMERRERELQQRAERNDAAAEERRAAMNEELSQFRENLTKEFESYKEEHSKKQVQVMKEKEMEIRAIMRRDRDKEIEKAVDCIEVEAQEARKEMQDTIRRIKEKYESDICSLEESEKIAMQRCKDTREHLRDSQEQCALNQITITQLEGKIKQYEELKNQNAAHAEILLRAAETRGREEIEELRAQLHEINQQHKDEMHQLYAKVKVAVSRKDDALTAARREATSLRERCIRLESRLTAQQ